MSDEVSTCGIAGPSSSVPAAAVAISSAQFSQLMEAIACSQARMDDKLARFQAEVRQGQEDAAAKAMKRARYEQLYIFIRKGNEARATLQL